jgi:hypothetical protein
VAIIDKLLSAGEVVRDKFKETFGDPTDDMPHDDELGEPGDNVDVGPPLDVAGAYAALGLQEGATLADVRDAYRSLSRAWHPVAHRDGPESEGAKAMDRLLDALELLEEQLLPLPGATPAAATPRRNVSKRKRATQRKG